MRYISTRGSAPAIGFGEVVLSGVAPDGGLYVPEAWPRLSRDAVAGLQGRTYAETALAVLRPFVGGAVPEARLTAMIGETCAAFSDPEVAPLVPLEEGHWLLELHHGPTLAFKDIALQLLARLMADRLGGERLTVIGATSGDTGSAAIHALAGMGGVSVVMLHPKGRVSEVQRRQMTTVLAPNIHNLAVEGSFDDAQAIVKRLLRDGAAGHRLAAVNSVNFARLAAQVVYYFHAGLKLGALDRPVSFSVPTGNFGDVFAGYVAAEMGLPVARLIVATNANDILHRALSAGDYSRAEVRPTTSPSMDIQVSSNFERLLFDLMDRDPVCLAGAMADFEAGGRLDLPPALVERARSRFASAAVGEAEVARTIAQVRGATGMLIDPHTAIGVAAARRTGWEGAMVTLATAHAAKFPDAVEAAAGVRPALPERLQHLLEGEERMVTIPATLEAVSAYLAHLAARPVTA